MVGASAGGVTALTQFVALLPPDLPASVLVVLHVRSTGTSFLPDILSRVGALPASHAEDGERLDRRRIYVAPPDRHLLVEDGVLRLSRGPRENGHRPSIDALFRAAALAYGPRVVGLVLSGMLDDGALGARAIKAVGGVTVVQSPDEAPFPDLPRSAIAVDTPDYVAEIAEIAAIVARLAGEPVAPARRAVGLEAVAIESNYLERGEDVGTDPTSPWRPSDFVCPECGGVLREVDGDAMLRFRCRVGHAYSLGSLLQRQSDRIEEALWTSLRALEERAAMARRLSERLAARGSGWASRTFAERARETDEQASSVRGLIEALEPLTLGRSERDAEIEALNPGDK